METELTTNEKRQCDAGKIQMLKWN